MGSDYRPRISPDRHRRLVHMAALTDDTAQGVLDKIIDLATELAAEEDPRLAAHFRIDEIGMRDPVIA